ncbi:MAG: ester cyclase [Solirubrobacterales bacterium]
MNAPQDYGALMAEIWRRLDDEHRLTEIERYFADDYVRHSSEGDYDREGFVAVLEALHGGFPDLTSRVVDAVAEGDRLAYRWISEGTHRGEYMGVPATGRTVTATGITISRFDADGRVAEDWASWNKVSVLHTLGIIPID